MIRRIAGIAVARLLLGGLGLSTVGLGLASTASTGSAGATAAAPAALMQAVLPTHGSYSGVDHHGRMITFTYSGNTVSHFAINHQVVGGAHVSQGQWHETCHNGLCTKGTWTADGP